MDYTIGLWHGTTEKRAGLIASQGVDLTKCNAKSDFGRGFYLTSRREQAVEWGQDVADGFLGTEGPAAVLRYKLCFDAAASAAVLAFVLPSEQNLFWPFVERNRLCAENDGLPHGRTKGTAPNFDIVIGPVMKTRNPAKRLVDDGYDQYSFHTPLALNLLRLSDVEVLE